MNYFVFKSFFMLFLSSFVFARGGNKCLTCPSCMVCDPLVGCVYDNFTPCLTNKVKGLCFNGVCNTTISNVVKSKPPVCKTYAFKTTLINGTHKLSSALVDEINGLSCTKLGALLESVCIKGACTPYVLAIDKFGGATGCKGLPNGFMCDTNSVFTDGEQCSNGTCTMPENGFSFCKLP